MTNKELKSIKFNDPKRAFTKAVCGGCKMGFILQRLDTKGGQK